MVRINSRGIHLGLRQGKPSARLDDQEAAIVSMASPRDGKLLAIGNANRGIRVYTVTGPQ